jgi:23S rRNA C2498 (ribose-2'-O)-methylase RlmM
METGGVVQDNDEERLVEKLRKIEALFARATSAGERVAAENARDRIRQRLEQLERSERAIEMRFSLPDAWSKALFVALLRRYGLEPYRYAGQRRTTVMARVARTFAAEVLWPEFQELHATLRAHLESVTERVIAQAIHGDQGEAEERPGQGPGAGSPRAALGEE